MRCYSCDRINASHHDTETGRFYCNTCWDIIELTIGKKRSVLTEEEKDVTIDVLMEEEAEIADAIIESRGHASDVS